MRKQWFGLIAGIIVGLALVGGAAWAARQFAPPPPIVLHGLVPDPPHAVDFELRNVQDQPVRLRDFSAPLTLVFFGYTSCPDVCPLTLSQLNHVLNQLGERASEIQVVFISVDPEHDSPEKAEAYATAFNPAFIGLSGSRAELETVAAKFFIYAQPSTAVSGLVEHSSTITVVERSGNVRVVWPFGVRTEEMVADLRALLGE